MADNKLGYFGVTLCPGLPKPYQAQVRRGGRQQYLGRFVTAEEAALCYARSLAAKNVCRSAQACSSQ